MIKGICMSLAAVAAAQAAQQADITLHVITHSHMDAGWLKTVEGYYQDKVQYIFTSTVKALAADPTLTYTLGDIYYFKRWYDY